MLWDLIIKNPFSDLIEHMKKTSQCVDMVDKMFKALFLGQKEGVKNLAKEISIIEDQCDDIKKRMRANIAKSIFLPVEKRDLLQVLSNMDAIADSTEDLGVLLTMRWMELPENLKHQFLLFLKSSILVVEESTKVIFSLDRLLESGFSGPDADEIATRIDHIDHLEHECDKAQDQLGKKIFENEKEFSCAALIMWIKIIEEVGNMADCAEKMMNHIRLMIAVK